MLGCLKARDLENFLAGTGAFDQVGVGVENVGAFALQRTLSQSADQRLFQNKKLNF